MKVDIMSFVKKAFMLVKFVVQEKIYSTFLYIAEK